MHRSAYAAAFVACFVTTALAGAASSASAEETPAVAVGAQYDSTHVYVAPGDVDRFLASFLATFGGHLSTQGVATVTPTPSETISQLALTPAGTISVFGYKTPIPYPFGSERNGYLVTDLDVAIRSARANGASVTVAPFDDPIGRDAIVQWPGGVAMQLYWHTTAPHYAPLATIPENRIYLSPDDADRFVRSFVAFAGGTISDDERAARGIGIGRPNETYRRIRIDSGFGKVTVLVTDGRLPYPYGRELTGYEVSDLDDTLRRAKATGAVVLVEPYADGPHRAAMVRFPGGYIAEIHALAVK
jgi:predicted enzyme related to lactoylglutathione lyase